MKELSAIVELEGASCEAEVGNGEVARQKVTEALAISDNHDTRQEAADILARAGDAGRSQKLIGAVGPANTRPTPC